MTQELTAKSAGVKWGTAASSLLLAVAGLVTYVTVGSAVGTALLFLAIMIPLLVLYLKRGQVSTYLRHLMHLEVLPTVITNHIPVKARAYQNRKDDIETVLILIPLVVWVAWFFLTGDVWLPIIVAGIGGSITGIGWLLLRDAYRSRTRSRHVWETTLTTFYTDARGMLRKIPETDHWSVEWERLNPDDPKVVEARSIIRTSQQKWRREFWARKDPSVDAITARGPPVPRAAPPDSPPALHCTACGTPFEPDDSEYCPHCGARLLAEEYYYLVKRIETSDQYLLYTDCDITRHLDFVPNVLVYVSLMPVNMPCAKVGLVMTGLSIRDATGDLSSGMPIVMFDASAENTDRVLGMQQPAVASPERMTGAEDVMDGYLCVAGAALIRMHERKEQSLEDTLNRVMAESGKSTMRALDVVRKQGPPPPPPKPPRLSPRLKRILKVLVVVGVLVGVVVGAVFLGPSVLVWLRGGV